ncbi:hypothetical protein [Enterovibrio calviensis]|uniref:hypothetical protein n=1 Tax=Enterovibrio calviensis TaxID=91359 RepID=UPI000A6216AB|nr:hypothetical protein [Enterovibrio calviensis]
MFNLFKQQGVWRTLMTPVRATVTLIERIITFLAGWIRSILETGEITFNLESIGLTADEARRKWASDREGVIAMAQRNQIKIEQGLRLRDLNGDLVPASKERYDFNVVMGKGYFPIVGNLLIPAGAGTFQGQGCFVRRKSLFSAVKSVTTHPTALCPIGGTDNDGLLTQCGSSRIFDFAVSGCLKDPGDGGNGIVIGHTPPEPDVAKSAPPTSPQYWAGQPNRTPQKRFGKPQVWSDLTSFKLKNSNGDTEIIVPAKGTYSTSKDVLLDDTVDIPLVRWVRAFSANGTEIARYANVGNTLSGKPVGISAEDRQTTSNPLPTGETRVYHEPIKPSDKTTTVIVPNGLPSATKTVEVSFYNHISYYTVLSQMTPYLPGNYYTVARASYNAFANIVVEDMPWNGFVGVDGAYNTLINMMARANGLDGWFFPGGYEDYMHNSFIGCAGVNNQGWALFMSEPLQGSRNPADSNGWPTSKGQLEVHRKVTYIASSNDLANFDGYGNRNGALYMGANSNSMQTGSMEHHFDTHNIDPFGNASTKDDADWNPMRWTSLIVFTAESRRNAIVMTSTPTDTRRVTFCKTRLEQQSPLSGNPDSNIYSGLSANHYCHPRPDDFASLLEVRPPSIAHFHLTPYDENERVAGDLPARPGGTGELQGLFSGSRTVLFRPWIYDITPIKNHLPYGWKVVFSAKDKELPGAGKDVALSADSIGIAGQHQLNTLYFGTHTHNFKGRTIESGRVYTVSADISFLSDRFDDINMNLLSVSANYLFDEVKKTSGTPAEKLPVTLLVMPARIRLWENAKGAKKFYVEIPLLNTDSKDVSFPDNSNHLQYFKIKVETASVDTSLNRDADQDALQDTRQEDDDLLLKDASVTQSRDALN